MQVNTKLKAIMKKKKLKRNANPEKSKNITAFFNLHDKTLQ